MPCSKCGSTGHNAATCLVLIKERAGRKRKTDELAQLLSEKRENNYPYDLCCCICMLPYTREHDKMPVILCSKDDRHLLCRSCADKDKLKNRCPQCRMTLLEEPVTASMFSTSSSARLFCLTFLTDSSQILLCLCSMTKWKGMNTLVPMAAILSFDQLITSRNIKKRARL